MCKLFKKKEDKKKRFKPDWDDKQARKNRAIFYSVHVKKDEARELEEGLDEYYEGENQRD